MTQGPLEPVQASTGSVSIQIQAGPGQILSAKILTQASFCQTFARPLFGIYWPSCDIDLTQSIVKSDPVRIRLVLISSSTGLLDNSTEHFLKQTDKNNFNVCIHSV